MFSTYDYQTAFEHFLRALEQVHCAPARNRSVGELVMKLMNGVDATI